MISPILIIPIPGSIPGPTVGALSSTFMCAQPHVYPHPIYTAPRDSPRTALRPTAAAAVTGGPRGPGAPPPGKDKDNNIGDIICYIFNIIC